MQKKTKKTPSNKKSMHIIVIIFSSYFIYTILFYPFIFNSLFKWMYFSKLKPHSTVQNDYRYKKKYIYQNSVHCVYALYYL